MEFINAFVQLGPVAGTVVTVIIFLRSINAYMRDERTHREKIADECHAVQRQANEATFRAVQSLDKNSKVLEKVNVTLIRMNGIKRD